MADRTSATSKTLRKRFGAKLKVWREEAGLTQHDLAIKLGWNYYTMVSQIERGLSRIAPEDIPVWAEMLRRPPKEFAKQYLYYTDPYVYAALYDLNPIDEEKLKHFRPTKRGG